MAVRKLANVPTTTTILKFCAGCRFSWRFHTSQRMSEQPWYQSGLQFTCTGCGNCCTGPSGYVWASEDELRQIAEFRQQSLGEIRLFHTRLLGTRTSLTEYPNGDCTFFDSATRRCTIYPVRPTQCRTWPFWRSNLRSPETWEQVRQTCPGAGSGQFFSAQEIAAQVEAFEV